VRQRLEHAEQRFLAPYAQRSGEAARRHSVEDEGREFDYRTAFQRDRDRIVYSRAFRRLRQKAQAGLLPAYEDHRRNRLTHTLEVAQVARTIGRALKLNEDLVEAVSLGHDLGQPPFGAAGESALDDLLGGRLDGRGGPGLGDLGGFSRSHQGLRVVDRLEKRYLHAGLNLTDPVREGILKSGPFHALEDGEAEAVRDGLAPAFEVQVVLLADRIATALDDLDDALQSGGVELSHVERLRAVQELRRKLGQSYRPRTSRFMKANAIHRGLTHLLVTGAILTSEKGLERWSAKHTVRDLRSFRRAANQVQGDEIGLSTAGLRLLEDLEGFLEARVHRSFEADRVRGRGRRTVLGLFAAYQSDPSLLEPYVLLRFKEIAGVPYLRDVPRPKVEAAIAASYRGDSRFCRVLADYVAGMTDAYAITEHARLTEMGAIPMPSVEQLRRER
jgi:dGTPase